MLHSGMFLRYRPGVGHILTVNSVFDDHGRITWTPSRREHPRNQHQRLISKTVQQRPFNWSRQDWSDAHLLWRRATFR